MPQEQHPKRNVGELRSFELRNIVSDIQKLLWQVETVDDQQRSNGGSSVFWDADKPGSLDTLDAIAGLLEEYGLEPIDPPIVQGFDSIDEFIEALPKPPPKDFDAEWNAALLNTSVENDYGDTEDPEDWTPHAKPTS
jgi:hypothetical protein